MTIPKIDIRHSFTQITPLQSIGVRQALTRHI
jgi:hypothetical protein